jgi:3-hydroxyisobutyrate dehydrogenase
MKIAIIGCGEVGRLFASAAATHHDVALCDTHPSPAANAVADSLGVTLHTQIGPWLSGIDRVWACVTGDVALQAATTALEFMGPGADYVDLTTASPDDKRAAADLAARRGLGYVDVAIMGAIALTGIATPLLIAGVNAGRAAKELNEIGAVARASNGSAGDAIALKLLRTVLTKGVEALAVEAFIAAEKRGIRDELYRVLADVDEQGFTSFLNAVVRTHVLHAGRRMHEVERAIAQLHDEGLPALVLEGALGRFALTVAALQIDPPPIGTSDHIDSSVKWLLSSCDVDDQEPGAITRTLVQD